MAAPTYHTCPGKMAAPVWMRKRCGAAERGKLPSRPIPTEKRCEPLSDWTRWAPRQERTGYAAACVYVEEAVAAAHLALGLVRGRSHRMDAATLTYDTLRFEYEDFPETKDPVWILGRTYSVFTEKEEILLDVTSRLWFTYRKNFPAIGGTGPTSDTGWGCMLRCGQMIFAQALVCRHLGRDWRWVKGKRQTDNYFNILNAFIDKKDSYYSIHQIAQMGVGEGKSIGQWYGPNTVAQVLKKLATFDTWSSLAVHIAMDNTVVMEEISEELIYLDPHTTQPAVEPSDNGCIPDESFHCQHPPCRMSIAELDPSIAVGFFCNTEEDFNDWCQEIKKLSLLRGVLPMFELIEHQPSHFSSPDVLNLTPDSSDADRLERFFDSEDEDFEILSL
ncbi:cysteine protease ATG4B isoform X3 [Chelonia mydas]|uniref:cysteine protease ATG4B isoform X3 n=1 Tax=Chelonia mydas TaxID=8469 RepID=UPI001CA9E824|nr:cysteine protease ATG4B isoform X3 [Chelonia mydas]